MTFITRLFLLAVSLFQRMNLEKKKPAGFLMKNFFFNFESKELPALPSLYQPYKYEKSRKKYRIHFY